MLNGPSLQGLIHGSATKNSGPLSSGSLTSSGDQARSTPSINSECSNSMGSHLNETTPSGGSSGETDMTGTSGKKRSHSGQPKVRKWFNGPFHLYYHEKFSVRVMIRIQLIGKNVGKTMKVLGDREKQGV